MFKRKKTIEENILPKDTDAVRKICLNSASLEDYFWAASQKGDNNRMWSINELMPAIAMICKAYNIKSAVEFGTAQCRSSAALAFGGVQIINSVDIVKDEVVDHFKNLTYEADINWNFNLTDSRNFDVPISDLLLIDSMHNAEHLEKELDNATQNITKLILLHDTKSYGEIGDNGEGLNEAIENFLKKNSEWKKLYFFEYNNGLSVLIKNE